MLRLVVEIVALRDFHQVSFFEGLPLQQCDLQLSFGAAELSDEAVEGECQHVAKLREHVKHMIFNIESVHGDFGDNSEAK